MKKHREGREHSMNDSSIGDIYYYTSRHLVKTEEPHYHVVVAVSEFGEEGMPQKGLVIISSHTDEKEEYVKQEFGEGSYVILGADVCKELTHKSIIDARIHLEDENLLRQEDRRGQLSKDQVEKIVAAAKKHRGNTPKIKKLLE